MARPPVAVAAILLFSLVALSPRLVQGQEVEQLGASGFGEETKELNVPVWMSAFAEVLWAMFNAAVGFFLWAYLSGLNAAGDMAITWFLVGMRIIEGVAFVIYVIYLLTDNKKVEVFFLGVQAVFHAPLLWAVAVYIRKHDRPKGVQTTLTRVAPLMVIFGFLIFVSPIFELPGFAQTLFMITFEPPLLFQVLYIIGLWVASCRPTCRDPRIQSLSCYLTICALIGFLAHLRHVIMIGSPELETKAGMIMQKIVEAAMILGTTYLIVQLAEIGAFTDARHKAGSPWATEHGIPLAEGTQRWIASPERLWSFSFIFYAGGFAASAYCLFIVIGFDVKQDPIVGFYGTMHPCVLLDYVPGTLFAQPLFDCQILITIGCMALNFMRHVVDGSVFKIVLSAGSMTLAAIIGACFNLVFTFNPREVSVLLHSVPYMFNVALQGIFILSEATCIFLDQGYHKFPVFTLYALFVAGMCIFINYFMTRSLLMDWDRAKKPMKEWTAEELDFGDIPPRQLLQAFVRVIFLDIVFIMWYRVNPMANSALAFDLGVTNRELDEDAVELAELEQEELEMETTSGEDARMLSRDATGGIPTPREATGALESEATHSFGHLGPTGPMVMLPGETQQATIFYGKLEREVEAAPVGSRTPTPQAMANAGHPGELTANRGTTNGSVVRQQAAIFYTRPITLPAIFAASWAAFGLSACVFVNKSIKGEGALTWLESIHTYPGSSVLVVCWVFAAAGVILFVGSSIYYQELTNESRDMVLLTWVTGGVLVLCTLMAHGGTIPDSEIWLWYDGPRFFCTGLIAWTVKDILLLAQDWHKLRPTNAVPDLVSSVLTVGVLLLEVSRTTLGGVLDAETRSMMGCGAIIFKSVCESRGARIFVRNPAIVPVETGNCFGCCPPLWAHSPPEIIDGKTP